MHFVIIEYAGKGEQGGPFNERQPLKIVGRGYFDDAYLAVHFSIGKQPAAPLSLHNDALIGIIDSLRDREVSVNTNF